MTPSKTFRNLPHKKQQIIIDAALFEFAEKGYHGASINSIVQVIGIAKGSIYQYFDDKQSLFLYVFSISMEQVKDYLREVRDATKSVSIAERLEKTLESGVEFIRKNPIVYRLYIKIQSETEMPFRGEILRSLKNYSYEYIETLLTDAKNKGELKSNIDIKKSGFIIDAVMDRFLLSRALKINDFGLGIYNADNERINAWVTSLVSTLCNGIAE